MLMILLRFICNIKKRNRKRKSHKDRKRERKGQTEKTVGFH